MIPKIRLVLLTRGADAGRGKVVSGMSLRITPNVMDVSEETVRPGRPVTIQSPTGSPIDDCRWPNPPLPPSHSNSLNHPPPPPPPPPSVMQSVRTNRTRKRKPQLRHEPFYPVRVPIDCFPVDYLHGSSAASKIMYGVYRSVFNFSPEIDTARRSDV